MLIDIKLRHPDAQRADVLRCAKTCSRVSVAKTEQNPLEECMNSNISGLMHESSQVDSENTNYMLINCLNGSAYDINTVGGI
jgi:hypothetical protein